jgi:Tfp pilus assembly protein PilN
VNHIDFLPPSYHEQRAGRGLARRRWVLIALTLLALTGWAVARHKQSSDLAWRASALESQAQTTQQKRGEMEKLRTEQKALLYQQKVQRQISQSVAVSQAIATLGRQLPDSAGLTSLLVTAHRPPPKPLEDPDDKKAKRAAKKKPDAQDEVPPDYLAIEVQGLAPDDVTVANLVNTMSEHPLFEKVTMNFSRVDTRGDLISRRFQISAEVPLDRRYIPMATSAGVSNED